MVSGGKTKKSVYNTVRSFIFTLFSCLQFPQTLESHPSQQDNPNNDHSTDLIVVAATINMCVALRASFVGIKDSFSVIQISAISLLWGCFLRTSASSSRGSFFSLLTYELSNDEG